jgi:hypothetical protein
MEKQVKEIRYKKIGVIMGRIVCGKEEYIVVNKKGEVVGISQGDIKNFIRNSNFIR